MEHLLKHNIQTKGQVAVDHNMTAQLLKDGNQRILKQYALSRCFDNYRELTSTGHYQLISCC